MKQKPVSIAAWSIGNHAVKNTLPALNEAENLFFKGICTRNTEILLNQSRKYGVQAYISMKQMLNDNELDAVYIASPVGIHFEQAKAALQANKHVIVEKSSFETLKQADELIELSKEKDLVLMEAFMYRFHEQFVSLRELIQSKRFGRIRRIIATFGFPHLPVGDIRLNADIAGGSLFDAGAYPISALNQLLPSAKVNFSRQSADNGYKVDTNGLAVLLSEKTEAIGIASWCFGADYKNEIEVWCEDATIIVKRAFSKPPTLETSLEIYKNGSLYSEIKCEPMNHFVAMFEYFVECINSQLIRTNERALLISQMKLMASIRGNKSQCSNYQGFKQEN
ncbi:MAG: Gfo/Idh/MocA family oxidoreductase [Syntrophomonadaceae bacterium]|nr:Gfo/Idh/MocA family oxidoreductase [Syntrophomonadaceae bacterium]